MEISFEKLEPVEGAGARRIESALKKIRFHSAFIMASSSASIEKLVEV